MINPILASSARQRMRSLRTPILVTLYSLLLLAFVYFFSFSAFGQASFTMGQLRKSVEGYVYLLVIQFGLLVLVGPAMMAGSIAGERERQTLDLLHVTNTSSMSIVSGKLMESFGFLCLLIISSLPMMGLILLTGGVDIVQLLTGVLFLLLVALATLSVGLCASVFFRRTVTATVVAYLTVFAIGALTLVPLLYDVRRFGDLYNAIRDANGTLTVLDGYTPVSFLTNPALGLFSLIADQTKLMHSTIGQFSHTLNVTFDYLPFGKYAWYNMAFMAAASALLVLLSALRLRYRKADRPRIRRGK
ncbi:MAG: ABC transporter permease [Candidatus Limiplasma sp.]|nr:ABC transporter permease [Candidatus Limiplasma sp.]